MAGDQYQVSDFDPILQRLTVVLDAHSVKNNFHGTGQAGRGSRVEGRVLFAVCLVLERKRSLLKATVRKRGVFGPTPSLFFWPGALAAHSGLLSPTPPPENCDRVVVPPCDTRRERFVGGTQKEGFHAGRARLTAIGLRLYGSNHGMKLLPRPLQILQNSHSYFYFIFPTGVICHACNLSLSHSLHISSTRLCDHPPPIFRKSSSPAPDEARTASYLQLSFPLPYELLPQGPGSNPPLNLSRTSAGPVEATLISQNTLSGKCLRSRHAQIVNMASPFILRSILVGDDL